MATKKESLFKQKLKQAKLQQLNNDKTNLAEPQQTQSFPQVFKIDKFHIPISQDSVNRHSENGKTINDPVFDKDMHAETQTQELTYLKKHQESLSKLISSDELNQINNENWNAVDSMNEEERQNYVNLIENTLPSHFIEKLRKNKKQTTNKEPINNSTLNPIPPSIVRSNPYESSQTKQVKEIPKQIQSVQQGKDKSEQNEFQEDSQNHKTVIGNIYLNIKTNQLSYLHDNVLLTLRQDEKSSFVNMEKIYQMITSENNQSQIIGAQLTLDWVKNILPTSNTVFFIDSVPFHSRIMLMQIYSHLNSIQAHLKSTKFYSCYVELLVKSVQILTCTYKNLSDFQLDEQIKFSQTQFQKAQKSLKDLIHQNNNRKNPTTNQQIEQKQSKQMLFESLAILHQSLTQQKNSREQSVKNSRQTIQIDEKFEQLKASNKIDDLIEACLIEQTLKQEQFAFYQIHPSINFLLQTVTDFWSCRVSQNLQNLSDKLSEVNEFYEVLYAFICKFNKKKRLLPFYSSLILNIFEGLLNILEAHYIKRVLEQILSKNFTEKISLKKNKSLNILKCSITFKILYIYRELSCKSDKLALFMESSQSRWMMTEQERNIIVYINFSHYLQAQDLKAQEIQMLQKMLQWIKSQLTNRNNKQLSCFLDGEQLLISLLGLFLSSEQEVYSLIDQPLLNDLFKSAIQFYESKTAKKRHEKIVFNCKMLTQHQIKRMIQNYNYNSFGNDIFTKVIFWVAASMDSQTEALTCEEVMMRYPMLFYYASQPQGAQKEILQTPISSNKSKNDQNQYPLLGNIENYIKPSKKSSKDHFSYKSNEQSKANVLGLLFLNLDFGELKNVEHESLAKILGQQAQQKTRGFNMKKAKINEANFFYKYLMQPFMKEPQQKQLF